MKLNIYGYDGKIDTTHVLKMAADVMKEVRTSGLDSSDATVAVSWYATKRDDVEAGVQRDWYHFSVAADGPYGEPRPIVKPEPIEGES